MWCERCDDCCHVAVALTGGQLATNTKGGVLFAMQMQMAAAIRTIIVYGFYQPTGNIEHWCLLRMRLQCIITPTIKKLDSHII